MDEASEFLRQFPTRLIVIAGMFDTGKTTLLARIGEMFGRGPVAGYSFAGSRTLVTFEELGWYATLASGLDTPTTPRTTRSENQTFLHLCVRRSGESVNHLLLGDIAGETFPDAAGDETVCRNLHSLNRADHLCIFLDAATICDVRKRHGHRNIAREFTKRALQTGQAGRHTCLDLIIARWDLLEAHENRDDARKFVDQIEADFREKFEKWFGHLNSYHLAARPAAGHNPTLDEISALFRSWINDSTRVALDADLASKKEYARDFCRFGAQD